MGVNGAFATMEESAGLSWDSVVRQFRFGICGCGSRKNIAWEYDDFGQNS